MEVARQKLHRKKTSDVRGQRLNYFFFNFTINSSWNIGGSGQLRGSAPRCTKAYLSRILKSLRILQQVKNRLSEKCDRSTGTDVSNE